MINYNIFSFFNTLKMLCSSCLLHVLFSLCSILQQDSVMYLVNYLFKLLSEYVLL